MKDSNNGDGEVKLTDPTNGVAEIYLIPADTSAKTPGSVLFDVEMTLGGKKATVLLGYFRLDADVTT